MPYDIQALKDSIEKAKQNIKVFEDAIEKERKTIVEYRILIDDIETRKGRDNGNRGLSTS